MKLRAESRMGLGSSGWYLCACRHCLCGAISAAQGSSTTPPQSGQHARSIKGLCSLHPGVPA
jgi:hypothetical protein